MNVINYIEKFNNWWNSVVFHLHIFIVRTNNITKHAGSTGFSKSDYGFYCPFQLSIVSSSVQKRTVKFPLMAHPILEVVSDTCDAGTGNNHLLTSFFIPSNNIQLILNCPNCLAINTIDVKYN